MRRLVLLLVLLSVAVAQTEVLNTGSATLSITIAGSTPKEQVLYVPNEDARQTVQWPQGIDVQTDEEGNEYVNVNGDYDYTFVVTVDASYPRIMADDSFPVKTGENDEYTNDSAYIKPSDPKTHQKALDITKNSHTMLEAVRDLAMWVNTYIEYNTTYWGPINPSTVVLEERKGVCDEYANLYSALARSLGIPTRIATGVVKTGSTWQRHAWAESRVKNVWVPVDPTYGEVGLMNAFHVKLYAAPTYLLYQFPQSLEDISVTETMAAEYDVPLTVDASLSSIIVAPREKFSLSGTVTNSGDSILMPAYYAQKTVGIELLDSFRQNLVIHPGESKALEWDFAAPFGERDEYFIIVNGPGYDTMFNLTVNPGLTAGEEEEFKIIEFRSIISNSTLMVEADIRNTGNKDVANLQVSVSTTLGTVQKIVDLRAGEETSVSFTYPLVAGTYDVEVTVEKGSVKTTSYESVIVPEEKSKSIFAPVVELVQEHISLIYIAVIAVVLIGVAMVFVIPSVEGLKEPFEEREEWAKLVKLRKRREY